MSKKGSQSIQTLPRKIEPKINMKPIMKATKDELELWADEGLPISFLKSFETEVEEIDSVVSDMAEGIEFWIIESKDGETYRVFKNTSDFYEYARVELEDTYAQNDWIHESMEGHITIKDYDAIADHIIEEGLGYYEEDKKEIINALSDMPIDFFINELGLQDLEGFNWDWIEIDYNDWSSKIVNDPALLDYMLQIEGDTTLDDYYIIKERYLPHM